MMEENEIKRRPRRQSPVARNRNLQGRYLAGLLAFIVFLFCVLGLCLEDRQMSENENRGLAQLPKFNLETVADGSFWSDLSTYVADQFPGRDTWITINLGLNKTLGSKEAGGVYLCDDNYLMQLPGEPNMEQLQRNLTAMEAFARSNPNMRTVASIVPNAVTVMADKLPKNAPVRDQRSDLATIKNALNSIEFVDVTAVLQEHSAEELFYRTDHHWTSLGAGYAFQEIATALDITPPALSTYTRYMVSTTFEGTLSSKSGSHKVTDKVELFVPATQIEYSVKYPEASKEICSMYKREALDVKDHYTVFFGGNYSRVDITTTADTERALLIFKDSYANCFVQFLYPYYDKIVMIDPRYYYDNVENVLTSEGITDVLFLYNLDTFMSDASLADVITLS